MLSNLCRELVCCILTAPQTTREKLLVKLEGLLAKQFQAERGKSLIVSPDICMHQHPSTQAQTVLVPVRESKPQGKTLPSASNNTIPNNRSRNVPALSCHPRRATFSLSKSAWRSETSCARSAAKRVSCTVASSNFARTS